MTLPEDIEYYNLSKLKEMSRGNQDFVIKLIHTFITETQKSLDILSEYIKNEDYIGIKATSHKMKPSTAMMSIPNARETLDKIEILALEKNGIEDIKVLFNKINPIYLEAIRQLKNV